MAITENGLPVMKQGFQFDKDDLEGLRIMLQTLSNYLAKPDDQSQQFVEVEVKPAANYMRAKRLYGRSRDRGSR